MSDLSHELEREWAATLKHDLGKYVAWRSANLPESAWSGELDDLAVQALRADVLETREHAGQVESAWLLFERLTAEWPQPWPAELHACHVAVEALRACAGALQGDDRSALAAARGSIRSAQTTIRAELAALHRRLVPRHREA